MEIVRKIIAEPIAERSKKVYALTHTYKIESLRIGSFPYHADIDQLPFVHASTKLDISQRLIKVRAYIDMHYEKSLNVKDLSKIACISVHHFKRLFKALFKISPHQYMVCIRLNRAQELLIQSDLSINEICNAIGFQNTSSFIRLFKSYFGVTPSYYRRLSAA